MRLFLYHFSFHQPARTFKYLPGIETDYLNKSDLSRVLTLDFSDSIKADTVVKRLSESEECYIARWKKQVVSYCWFSTQAVFVKEIGKYFQVREGEVYLYDAATRLEWRGRGLYPLLLSEILALVAQRDIERAYIFTDSANIASQKGIIKSGFKHFQTITSFNLFGTRLIWQGKIKEKGLHRLLFLNIGYIGDKITTC